MFSETFSSVEELIRSGRGTPLRTQSVEEIVADEKLAEELRGRAGQTYLKIIGVRPTNPSSNATVAGYVEVYVDSIYSGIRDLLPKLKTTIAEAIDDRYNASLSWIEQDITVCLLSKEKAKVMNVLPKTPGLKIQRWYHTANGRVFEVATSYYPMGGFTYHSVLRRT